MCLGSSLDEYRGQLMLSNATTSLHGASNANQRKHPHLSTEVMQGTACYTLHCLQLKPLALETIPREKGREYLLFLIHCLPSCILKLPLPLWAKRTMLYGHTDSIGQGHAYSQWMVSGAWGHVEGVQSRSQKEEPGEAMGGTDHVNEEQDPSSQSKSKSQGTSEALKDTLLCVLIEQYCLYTHVLFYRRQMLLEAQSLLETPLLL